MPFEDARFDAVASNFGFLHFPYPEVALAETARVLEDQEGKLAFTAWTHDAGHRSLMARAIQEHGDPDVPLVAGPPEPFLEDDAKCAHVMQAAGFAAPEITGFTLYMEAQEPARIIEVFEKSTVRTASRLASQTAEAREKIREALVSMLGEYESGGTIAGAHAGEAHLCGEDVGRSFTDAFGCRGGSRPPLRNFNERTGRDLFLRIQTPQPPLSGLLNPPPGSDFGCAHAFDFTPPLRGSGFPRGKPDRGRAVCAKADVVGGHATDKNSPSRGE